MQFLAQEEDLSINSNFTAIYFYTTWMPFHQKMMVMISKIEEKYKNLKFFAIDADAFNTTCKRFNVNSVPTVIVFVDGKEKKRVEGLVMTSAFKHAFVKVLGEKYEES